jgi:RNA polymerase sigma factor (sigma-70 family)
VVDIAAIVPCRIRAMEESVWFSTRSALLRGGDASWECVAAYAEPLSRWVRRRYRWLSSEDREDLVQSILLEIRQGLAARHDPSRGRFRALLQAVVHRRVTDALRRRRAEPLEETAADALAAPPADEVEALDLEAALLEAFTACRDRFSQGAERDLDVVYALADRMVHGKSNVEIAREKGVSVDRVARLLRRGRDALFEALLARELELPRGDARLPLALDAFKDALREPRRVRERLARVPDRALEDALDAFLARFRAALPRLEGDETEAGIELRRGLDVIFREPA